MAEMNEQEKRHALEEFAKMELARPTGGFTFDQFCEAVELTKQGIMTHEELLVSPKVFQDLKKLY